MPKVSKRVLNLFWGKCFDFFCAVFDGASRLRKSSKKNPKNFKIPKTPKIVPKSIQTCFEQVLGQTFRKFFAQFSMEGRVLENFQKNTKFFKIPKTTKILPKSIQTSFDVFWGKLFENFLPNFPWKVESSKIFKKIKLFKFPKTFKISKMPKIVPKSIQTYFERLLRQIFRKVFAQFSTDGRLLKNFQNSKNDQNRSQKYPNEF